MFGFGSDDTLSFAGLLDFDASIDDWMGVIKELFAALAGFLKYFGFDLFTPSEEETTADVPAVD